MLDLCAGSGGKTLAFAPQMKGSGKIFLYDVRESILKNARKRLARASVTNIEIINEKENLKKLRNKMDWVVADVPCSGTGTLRRNPDLKLHFTLNKLNYYTELQESIGN